MLPIASLLLAAAVWLPSLHFFFKPRQSSIWSATGVPPKAVEMAARHLSLWTNPEERRKELARMRRSNAEWDFMGRTFLVLSLAEMSLRDTLSKARHLQVMDTIIAETVRLESEHGIHFFLMPYSRGRPFMELPERSLFLDSEIALMIGARRMVEEKTEYRGELSRRVAAMVDRMKRSRELAAESYPNECWLFDHAMALAAIRIADVLDGADHSALIQQWIATAKAKLIQSQTGLLVSSYTTTGQHLDGPEGSSIWLAIHCLKLVDEEFARDQYMRAKRELARTLCGFAWSKEWPASRQGPRDIDSGAVIPVLEVSAGGSGLAFIAASSFEDMRYLSELHTTLDFAALPERRDGRLKYCASNQVGDAAMLYSLVLGPLWNRVKQSKL
jgi:hypothetical protein